MIKIMMILGGWGVNGGRGNPYLVEVNCSEKPSITEFGCLHQLVGRGTSC